MTVFSLVLRSLAPLFLLDGLDGPLAVGVVFLTSALPPVTLPLPLLR